MTFTPTLPAQRTARLSDLLLQQGADESPVQSPWQALARIVAGATGGYMGQKADQEAEGANRALAQALKVGTGSPAGLDKSTGITWNQGLKPDQDTMMSMLLQNKNTAPFAQQLAFEKLTLPLEIEKARAIKAASADDPSSIKEWKEYLKLTPDKRAEYLTMKRATQTLNLGGQQVVLSPTGGIKEKYDVTPKPEDMPEFKGEQEKQKKIGERQGETQADVSAQTAQLPNLIAVTQKLSELGKKATYTLAGQGVDFMRKQTGAPTRESAVARAEYVSTVDNEVLPLLRQTFGAAFTQKEGESLKATLGDPNMSPAEKDAVLRSFIQSKVANIESKQRELGQTPNVQPLIASDPQGNKVKFNPQTNQWEPYNQ